MKFSLNQQIEEVERELQQRRSVYPRLTATGKLRESVAEYQVGRMEAVRRTLQWLRDNEAAVRAAVPAGPEGGA